MTEIVDKCAVLIDSDLSSPNERKQIMSEIYDEALALHQADADGRPIADYIDDLISDRMEFLETESVLSYVKMQSMVQARQRAMTAVTGRMTQGRGAHEATIEYLNNEVGRGVSAEGTAATSRLLTEMRAQGVDAYFVNPDNHLDIMTELHAITSQGANVGTTGSKNALKVATIVNDMNKVARQRMGAAGIHIRDLDGYTTKQQVKAERLTKVSSDDFVKDMLPRIDRKRIFGRSVSDVEARKYLAEFYHTKLHGDIQEVGISLADADFEIMGKSLSRRIEASRGLHMKSPEDMLHVNRAYGDGDIFHTIFQTVNENYARARLTELMGANPQNTKQWIKAEAAKMAKTEKERLKIIEPSFIDTLLGNSIDAIMANVDGSINRVDGSQALARNLDNYRNYLRSVFLGQVLISSITDWATRIALWRSSGAAASKASGRSFNLAAIADENGKRAFAIFSDAFTNNMIGTIHGARHGMDTTGGAMLSLTNKLYKFSGMNWWTTRGKENAAFAYSSAISEFLNLPYGKVEADFRNRLTRAGITEKEWAVFQTAKRHQIGDSPYLAVDNMQLSDAAVLKYSGKDSISAVQQKRIVDDLQSKMLAFITSLVDEAVPTPDARTRSMMNLGESRGTFAGEVARSMTFLLGYPLQYMNNMREMWRLSGTKKGALMHIGYLTGISTMLGYVSMMAKDHLNGRDRDYTSANAFGTAFMYGGGGGIIGSMIASKAMYDESAVGLVTGIPLNFAADKVDAIIRAGGYVAAGDFDKAGTTLTREVRSAIPLGTLPGVKQMIDYGIYYPMLDVFDGATLRNMENNWEKRTGGDMFVSPRDNIWNTLAK